MRKALTLSIVIPVYNEERHIKACLEAIKGQRVKPDEVIVVDNNCTDRTVAIAQSYPFVKIVKEPKQGHAPPRNRGFNTARMDIIGRIDADSQLMPDWVARVKQDFADTSVAGVTGLGKTDIIPRLHGVKSTLWSRVYYWRSHAYFNTITTWGANMAIRRTAWLQVKNKVRQDDALTHEDQDVALFIAAAGGRIIQDNKLLITTCGQTYNYFPKLVHYTLLATKTKRFHESIGTFTSPKFSALGFWRTLPGRIMASATGSLFIVGSFLFWPLDYLMMHVVRQRYWLR